MDRQNIGAQGQKHAQKFLKDKGYTLLTRNWRSKLGEIDLIFTEKGTLIFVEVKTLVAFSIAFRPEDHLTFWKEKKLKQLALAYLNYIGKGDIPYRIDLIAVNLDKDLQVLDIRHYESVIGD